MKWYKPLIIGYGINFLVNAALLVDTGLQIREINELEERTEITFLKRKELRIQGKKYLENMIIPFYSSIRN